MRDSLKEVEKIEKYLLGELNEEERKEFQKSLEEDETLSHKVELQRSLMKRVETIALKEKIRTAHRRNTNSAAMNWSNGKIVFSVLIVIILITTTIIFFNNGKEELVENTVRQEISFIQPPMEGVNVPFTLQSIDPTKENILNYESGSVLIIPPFSFADTNGKPISDSVQVKFREFSDVVDLYLSGIPMDYETNGESYPFESAAMCEIYVMQNGKEVRLNKGKKIEVMQSSYTNSDAFNLYRFNQQDGNWEEKGKDIGVNMNAENETQTMTDSMNQPLEEPSLLDELMEAEEPVTLKPQKADPKKLRFSISYEKNEFPELQSFDNVLFEIDESASNFQQGDNDIEWEDVRIERGDALSSYRVIFTKASENMRREYAVRPVFEGESYEDAVALYNLKMNSYTNRRLKREIVEADQDQMRKAKKLALERRNNYIDSMNAAIEQRNAIVKKRNAEIEQRNAEITVENKKLLARMDSIYQVREERRKENQRRYDSMRKNTEITNGLKRIYTIDQFGIWNSDCPTNLPKGATLAADFRINGESLNAVVLIDKNVRSLYNYYPYNFDRFQYNPASDNVVWAVADQKIVYFKAFEDLSNDAQTPYIIEMKELDIPGRNYKAVKSAIMNL